MEKHQSPNTPKKNPLSPSASLLNPHSAEMRKDIARRISTTFSMVKPGEKVGTHDEIMEKVRRETRARMNLPLNISVTSRGTRSPSSTDRPLPKTAEFMNEGATSF